ncbi:MAG: SLC13 family permease [Rhodomicrobium sp.]|nr:SLC13 family permease [Rhodomicrobium sp.]
MSLPTQMTSDYPASPRFNEYLQQILHLRTIAVLLAAAVIAGAIAVPGDLSSEGRSALAITLLAVIGWTLTRIPDVTVAIVAGVAMAAAGALPDGAVEASLGHPMIWLMLCAFVMAGVLIASGAAEWLALRATRPFKSVRGLFYGVTGVIFITAFIIPSTSGRAALLLPVFLVLAKRLPDIRLSKAFALMFPTVILLSAGGSLTGAGAHAIAADALSQAMGRFIGILEWSALTAPFALLSCIAAVELILFLFAPRDALRSRLSPPVEALKPMTGRQLCIVLVILAIGCLWATIPLHGLSAPIVALIGAAALLSQGLSGLKPKEAFRSVDVELLVFLAATLSLAKGLSATGADKWLAAWLLQTAPAAVLQNQVLMILLVATVATFFHLIVNSRTARAAVLFPVIVIPLGGLDHDMAILALVTILGTGFCQTLPASAKPVAVFASIEHHGFSRGDLLKLSAVLAPMMLGLLTLFGILIWPEQIAWLRAG